MSETVETVIVGGGQAGLATSYHLQRRGREHVVLEQAAQAGNAWRNDRWDSFTLVTPNWSFRLPGAEYDGDAIRTASCRATRSSPASSDYVERFLPAGALRGASHARSSGTRTVTATASRRTRTRSHAANVVIATGLFQRPKVPPFSARAARPDRAAPLRPVPQSPGAAARRGAGGRQRAVGLPDRRGAVPERAPGLPVRRQRRARPSPVSGQGHLRVAAADRVLRQDGGRPAVAQGQVRGQPARLRPRRRAARSTCTSSRGTASSCWGISGACDGDTDPARPGPARRAWRRRTSSRPSILERIDRLHRPERVGRARRRACRMLRDGYDAEEITELDLTSAGHHDRHLGDGLRVRLQPGQAARLRWRRVPASRQRGVTEYPGLFFVGLPWLYKMEVRPAPRRRRRRRVHRVRDRRTGRRRAVTHAAATGAASARAPRCRRAACRRRTPRPPRTALSPCPGERRRRSRR